VTLSPAWLDELRARTTLSAIIAPTVKLTKAGREYKACCPFHNEKTPSFTVNDEKGFYHCFGCGAHGDAIRFLTDARGLPFMDAVKELAGKAGMDVPAPDPRAAERQERAKGLHDVMAAAQAWFEEQLEGIDGSEARAYLKQRGITAATRKKFGFGLAPDARGKLKAALAEFGNDKLIDCGLLIQPDDDRDPYDRFRGRLTYPIKDQRGRVIAFSARILGAGEPKYLNSPDTPLFDKGRSLFNIDRAGPASRIARRLLVVEGQMDAIALDQAGIGEVVAPLGTAVTEAQLERMWRLEPAPIFCFDGDSAGEKAAVRAALRALPHLAPERTLRFVSLPAGQDPDDLIKSGGAAAMEKLLAEAEPLVDHLWRHEVAALPLDTPEARAGLKARLLDHTQAIGDPSVRQLYRDEWLRRFDALVRPQASAQRNVGPRHEQRGRPWRKDGNRFVPPQLPPGPMPQAIGRVGIEPPFARALLTGFILYPDALHDHVEELAHLAIADRTAAELRDELVRIAMSGQHLDRAELATILADKAAGSGVRRGAMRFSFTRTDSQPDAALNDLGAALEAAIGLSEIRSALDDATARFQGDMTDEAYAEQQRLKDAQTRFNDRLASLAGSE
jgi:DNA primase